MTSAQLHDLRTEYASNPLGIDELAPDLRWRVESDRRGAAQSAFRVLVASTPDRLQADEGDVWDTGKRRSSCPAVTYDGPPLEACTDYHWKVRVWDDGVESDWSERATWGMGPLETEDWEASWIRRPGDGTNDGEFQRGQFTYVRREVTLEAESDLVRARAYVSASHQYELSINGVDVDRGQSFSYPDAQYYKTVDVTDALESGENVIGALFTWLGEGQGRREAEPGFLCQLRLEYDDGSERVVATDDSWHVRKAAWDEEMSRRNGETFDPVETIDGRRTPVGWNEPGFDEDDDEHGPWELAAVVGIHPTPPWKRLLAQPRGVVGSTIEPESVTRLETGTLVFDFGRVYTGLPVVRFEAGVPGRRIEMRAGYCLREDGEVDDEETTQWTDMSYAYIQRDGKCTFRPFNYLGFRYLQIDDRRDVQDTEQVPSLEDEYENSAVDVSLWALHNDVPDTHAAAFTSSNETVDAVFKLARHSVLYGSQEQFIDTPTREKGQFLMDAFNISQAANRAFRERTLTRQAILEFVRSHERYWAEEGRVNAVYPNGDGKRDIPDFTEVFPEWVWQYYRTAGDRRILELAFPVVEAIADYVDDHIDEETGLVTNLAGGVGGPYEEGIIDWPPEMRYGYDREWPARTTINVLAANVFDKAATAAAELDRQSETVDHYRDRQRVLEGAIDEYLVRDDGIYIDGCDTTAASEHASQHANALPLAFGLVPDERVAQVAAHIANRGMQMGPMMVPWLLEALETAERTDALVGLLTNPDDDGWANILARDGTFTWESWHCRDPDLPEDERRNRSESHAMGATVLVSIQRALLGVRFADLEGSHLEIRPPTEGLSTASGRVPTERGTVDVSWVRSADTFEIDVTVPWNTTATVTLPRNPTGADVLVNSDIVEPGAPDTLPKGVTEVRSIDRPAVTLRTGTYRLTLE